MAALHISHLMAEVARDPPHRRRQAGQVEAIPGDSHLHRNRRMAAHAEVTERTACLALTTGVHRLEDRDLHWRQACMLPDHC